MTFRTNNINRAAFFTSFGAKVIEFVGKYPDFTFVLDISPWLLFYERTVGLVPYRRYSNQRIRLKRRGRRQANLPEKFTGHNKGFTFADFAHVK